MSQYTTDTVWVGMDVLCLPNNPSALKTEELRIQFKILPKVAQWLIPVRMDFITL